MLFYKCAQLVEYSGTCVHTLILAGGCDSLVIQLHDNQGWGVSPEANVCICDCTACQYSHAGASVIQAKTTVNSVSLMMNRAKSFKYFVFGFFLIFLSFVIINIQVRLTRVRLSKCYYYQIKNGRAWAIDDCVCLV